MSLERMLRDEVSEAPSADELADFALCDVCNEAIKAADECVVGVSVQIDTVRELLPRDVQGVAALAIVIEEREEIDVETQLILDGRYIWRRNRVVEL